MMYNDGKLCKVNWHSFYLDLIGAGLERVDADNLLEAIETDDDEAVI